MFSLPVPTVRYEGRPAYRWSHDGEVWLLVHRADRDWDLLWQTRGAAPHEPHSGVRIFSSHLSSYVVQLANLTSPSAIGQRGKFYAASKSYEHETEADRFRLYSDDAYVGQGGWSAHIACVKGVVACLQDALRGTLPKVAPPQSVHIAERPGLAVMLRAPRIIA